MTSEQKHFILRTYTQTSALGYVTKCYECNCGKVSRWMSPEHLNRSMSMHRRKAAE